MKNLFRMKEFLKVSASGESLNQLTQPSQTCFSKAPKSCTLRQPENTEGASEFTGKRKRWQPFPLTGREGAVAEMKREGTRGSGSSVAG